MTLQWPSLQECSKLFMHSASNINNRGRLIAIFAELSWYWLQIQTLSNICTLLHDLSLSPAVCVPLGVKTVHPNQCTRGDAVDKIGHYSLLCIRRALSYVPTQSHWITPSSSGYLSVPKYPLFSNTPAICRNNGKRNLIHILWKQVRPLVWVVENCKRLTYAKLNQCYSLPFAVKPQNLEGPQAKLHTKKLSDSLVVASGYQRTCSYFGQRINLAILRGHVANFLARWIFLDITQFSWRSKISIFI